MVKSCFSVITVKSSDVVYKPGLSVPEKLDLNQTLTLNSGNVCKRTQIMSTALFSKVIT